MEAVWSHLGISVSPFPFLPFLALPFPLFPLSIEVGTLKSRQEVWGAVSSPSGVWPRQSPIRNRILAHFSFKIWHLVVSILLPQGIPFAFRRQLPWPKLWYRRYAIYRPIPPHFKLWYRLRTTLSPVHTGDYSRRIRRLSPKTATESRQCGQGFTHRAQRANQ